MIKTGEITCRIPSNGIKREILYCTEPEGLRLDIWTVSGSWVTALATIVLVILAAWAGKTAVDTLKQAKIDSIAQSRPYVYASVVPGLAGEGAYDLVIKNLGTSAARDIKIECPEIPDDPDEFATGVKELFARKLALPPQASIRVYWRMDLLEGSHWLEGGTDPLGMPSVANLDIRYKGDVEGEKVYASTERLDTGIFKMAPVASSGPNARPGTTSAEKDLHKMLGLISQSIRELGR